MVLPYSLEMPDPLINNISAAKRCSISISEDKNTKNWGEKEDA